jgi:hypothetical protein
LAIGTHTFSSVPVLPENGEVARIFEKGAHALQRMALKNLKCNQFERANMPTFTCKERRSLLFLRLRAANAARLEIV